MTTARECVGGTGRRDHFDGGITVPPLPPFPPRQNTVTSLEKKTFVPSDETVNIERTAEIFFPPYAARPFRDHLATDSARVYMSSH